VLHVRRVKNGTPSTHPLLGDELRALRWLQRERPPSAFILVSERGTPFTTAGFARMIERAARRGLGLELKAHLHMLRHACGCALANRGTIPGRSRGGWGTARSRARRCTRPWRRTGSRTSGEAEPRMDRFPGAHGTACRKIWGGGRRKSLAPLLFTPWLATNQPPISPKMSHTMRHIPPLATETLLDAHRSGTRSRSFRIEVGQGSHRQDARHWPGERLSGVGGVVGVRHGPDLPRL
jgi:Phage integrase family